MDTSTGPINVHDVMINHVYCQILWEKMAQFLLSSRHFYQDLIKWTFLIFVRQKYAVWLFDYTVASS